MKIADFGDRRLDLRQRLLLAIILPLLLIFASSTFFDYRLARETADATFDQSLADAVLDIAAHIRSGNTELAVTLSAEAEAMLRSDAADQIYFAVRDKNGQLLAGDTDLPFIITPPANQPHFIDSTFRGMPTRTALHRINSPHGIVMITVAETVTKRDQTSHRIMAAMIAPNLLALLATLLTVYFGVRRGLAPLDAVEKEIASRSPQDLREIDIAASPREIRPMLARLNHLFVLLRAAAAAQQRFLADAAHQLRTPLAGLQTQIELASGEGSFAPASERLSRIDEAIGRIGHLVEQLLTYARAEPTAAASQIYETVALQELVEQAASTFLDRALAKGIDIGFEANAANVIGIPWMLREALSNLIDNALRYTPPGGIVTVSCEQHERQAFLRIEDNGPSIPVAERQQVFARFYRLHGAPGNGCGLGLAIVKEIVDVHAATITLGDSVGGGLRAEIVFPAV